MTTFSTFTALPRWWLKAVRELVPDLVIDWLAGLPRRRSLKLDAEAGSLRIEGKDLVGMYDADFLALGSKLPEVRHSMPSRVMLDVVLPSCAALIRRHSMPRSSKGQIRNILALDLSRDTPLEPVDVAWREVVVNQSQDLLEVDQIILKRRQIQSAIGILEAHGILPGRVAVMSERLGRPCTIVSNQKIRERAIGHWPKVNLALGIICLALLATALTVPLLRDLERSSTFASENTAIRKQLVQLRTEVNAKEAALKTSSSVAKEINQRLRAVDVLDELTRRLPDDTWLSDLEIVEHELSFSGFTRGSAAELVISLSESPSFSNPRLTGPVSIAPGSGAERFRITIDLRRFAG
ncbi:MAG: PilN domain-containing protein [Pseudomonadota bacterium]